MNADLPQNMVIPESSQSSKEKKVLQQIQCLPSKRKREICSVTYVEYIEEALEKHQYLKQRIDPTGPFTISEDLTLMLELSRYQYVASEVFEQIAKIGVLHRDPKSMEARYREVLYFVKEWEMKLIVRHICKFGLDNAQLVREDGQIRVLSFGNAEESKQLQKITEVKRYRKEDPPTSIVQIQQPAPPLPQPEGPAEEPHNQIIEICKIQKVKLNIQSQQLAQFQQLKDIVTFCSSFYQIDILQILSHLDGLSGNLTALDYYLYTKDQTLTWSPEEDDALVRDDDTIVSLLIRYKGRSNTSERKRYLNIL